MKKTTFFSALLGAALMLSANAYAQDYTLTLKDHKFSPAELTVPANEKVKLVIKNEDDTPAEFESSSLNREKIVKGKSEISVFIGPLDPGRYEYEDEFHDDSAEGVIIAK